MTTIIRLIRSNSRPTRVVIMLAMAFAFSSGAVLAQTNVTSSGGTIGKIPKWNGQFSLQDSVIAESSSNIGIGTTNPLYKLDIFGTTASQLHLTSDGSSKGLYLFANGHDAYYLGGMSFDGSQWIAKSPNAAALSQAGGAFVFYSDTGLTAGNVFSPTERARLDVTGNFGIGTNSPGAKLEVAGNSMLKTSGPASFFYDTTGTANARHFYFWNSNGHLIGRWVNDANTAVVADSITFLNNGNVGIGTTDPWAKLNVQGGRAMVGALAEPYALGLHRTDASGAFWLGVTNVSGTAKDLIFSNNGGAELARITDTGSVGIGIAPNPSAKLHLRSADVAGIIALDSGSAAGQLSDMWFMDRGVIKWELVKTADNQFGVFDSLSGLYRAYFKNNGNVGIGTTNPTTPLHVVGAATITGAVSTGALTVTGNITATGSVTSTYQDVAEWVPAIRAIPAGTVVTLDPERSNHVLASSHAYDTRVAGVVSARPGVILGEAGEGKVMVATTGRVRVKVDATNGPIRVGDLLVTSDKPGVAMKSQPLDLAGTPIHRPGTLIGKALEALENGVGEILVLLSLQ